MENSPKRISDCKSFQCFVNVKLHKLLHPAQTRRLSLLCVVRRLLEQLPALKLYFQDAVLSDRLLSAESILNKCIEPTTELYLEFLNFVLPYFCDLDEEMQSEQPKINLLYNKIFITYGTILECFIKSGCFELNEQEKNYNTGRINEALEFKILNINFEDTTYHLKLEKIHLGGNITAICFSRKHTISLECVTKFRQKCLAFYIEGIKPIRTRFPFEEKEQLKSLKFMDPETSLESTIRKTITSIAHLGLLFPGLSD